MFKYLRLHHWALGKSEDPGVYRMSPHLNQTMLLEAKNGYILRGDELTE